MLADLCDRRGVRQELDDVDHDMRAEIVAALATIIRASAADLLEALGEAEIMSNEAGRAGVDWRRRFAGVIARARGEG